MNDVDQINSARRNNVTIGENARSYDGHCRNQRQRTSAAVYSLRPGPYDHHYMDISQQFPHLFFWAAGDIVAPTRLDLPRGLNQLGNTCYLNSLLQVRMDNFNSKFFVLIENYSTFIPLKTSERLSCQC